jgi:hypothetical protein
MLLCRVNDVVHESIRTHAFRQGSRVVPHASRALWTPALGLPVVVAGALALVAVVARRHAQARVAALVAEEEARLLVLRVGAPTGALRRALCKLKHTTNTDRSMHHP